MKSRPIVAWVCLAALPLAALLILLAVENARLSRHTVSVITASAVGGFVVALVNRLGKGRLNAWLRGADPRALVGGFVAAVVSGLLYSVVHEFGHAIFAVALGGTVDSATWTIFGNAEPHVSYGYLPARAIPWAWAGGYLLPTALASVLIAAWYFRRRRWSPLAATVLLIPAAVMLLANLGCLPELFDPPSHIGRFTSYYGIGKIGEILVSLLFAGVSMAGLVAIASALKNATNTARGGPPGRSIGSYFSSTDQ